MNAPLPPDDDFLDDDSDLRALYGKLPAAEPPAALDARIRAQAHAAAQGDQRVRNKTRRIHPGWAIAASVLLASGLILMTDLPQQADQAGQAAAPGIDAELAQPLGAGAFEEFEVVGVKNDAARVGVLPVDPHRP